MRDALESDNDRWVERSVAGTFAHQSQPVLVSTCLLLLFELVLLSACSMIAELELKVTSLKHATQGIHDEVEADNRILSGMVSYESAWRLALGDQRMEVS